MLMEAGPEWVFVVICVALIASAFRSPSKFPFLAGIVLPFYTIGFSSPVNIWPAMVVGPIGIAGAVFRGEGDRLWGLVRRSGLWLFAGWALVITALRVGEDLLSEVPSWRAAAALGWAPAQAEYRLLVQMASFLAAWSAIVIGALYLPHTKCRYDVLRGIIVGAGLNAVLGLYQLASYRFGLPFPHNWLSLTRELDAGAAAERLRLRTPGETADLFRLCGLGGEPKHAAAVSLCALLCVLLLARRSTEFRGRYLVVGGLLATAIVLTFSSSTWAVAPFSLTLAYAAGGRLRARSAAVLVGLGGLAVGIGVGLFRANALPAAIFESRISSRATVDLEQLSLNEPRDAAMLDVLTSRAGALVFGHGAGGIDFRLLSHPFLTYWVTTRSSTISPGYTGLRLLADFGLVGLAALSAVVLRLRRFCVDRSDRSFVLIAFGTMLFLPVICIPAFILVGGGVVASQGAVGSGAHGQGARSLSASGSRRGTR